MGKKFGNFLRRQRETAGLSQSEIAHKVGLKSAQFISNIERGIAPLPRDLLVPLADILRVPKDSILDAVVEDIRDSYLAVIEGRSGAKTPRNRSRGSLSPESK